MLSPVLLERLRVWWKVARAQGKMLDGGWLFPGLNPIEPLSYRQLNRAIHMAADAAHIDKRVSMHTQAATQLSAVSSLEACTTPARQHRARFNRSRGGAGIAQPLTVAAVGWHKLARCRGSAY